MPDVGTIHVNGPALIRVGAAGFTSSGLMDLGFSESGVDISITDYTNRVMTDAAGGAVPHELGDMGMDAVIRCRLPMFDAKAMAFVRTRRSAGGVEGTSPVRGGLIMRGGAGIRVVITSPTEGLPWRFLFCTPQGPRGGRYGTVHTVEELTFYAIQQEVQGKWWLYDRNNQ
jgi:hypothetical protein